MKVNNGGQAFPIGNMSMGMTLRDYFAAKFAQSLILKHIKEDNLEQDRAYIAFTSYQYADAMIKAREVK